jgi:hypothetical protein
VSAADELAVKLTKFSDFATGKLGIPSCDCRAELAAQLANSSDMAAGNWECRAHTAALSAGYFLGSSRVLPNDEIEAAIIAIGRSARVTSS